MRLRLKKLRLHNFLSFAEESIEVDFPERGLVAIEGPSGSGKSSLVRGIAYPLGYEQSPATKLRTWLNDEPWSVELQLDLDGKTVTRRLGSKTHLQVDGEPTITSASVIKQAITKLFGGLDPDVLKVMTYCPQQSQGGALLSLPDLQKRAFLTRVIPQLSKFEQVASEAAKNVTDLEKQLFYSKTHLETLVSVSVPEPSPPIRTEGAVADLEDEIRREKEEVDSIAALAGFLEEKGSEKSALLSALSQEFDEILDSFISDPASVEIKVDDSRHKEALAAMEECRERYTRKDHSERLREQVCFAAAERAKVKAAQLEGALEELAELEANKCPRCYREWDLAPASKQDLLETIETIRTELQSAECESIYQPSEELVELGALLKELTESFRAAEDDLERRIAEKRQEIQAVYEQQRTEREHLRNERKRRQDEISNRYTAIAEEVALQTRHHKQELELARERISSLRESIAHAKAVNHLREEQRRTWEDHHRALVAAQKAVEETQAKLNLELDCRDLFRDFLGGAMSEILDEISTYANQVLARVENTQDITISFQTEVVKDSGEHVTKIVPVISVRGHEIDSVAGLSGGQRTMVNLAVDVLAVGEVASRRSGFSAGWVILDESFDGMGAKDREGCMEVLKQYASDRLVIVVTHSVEFRELFDHCIRVEIDSSGRSSIVVDI